MTRTRTFLRAFSGGEVSPEMLGRIDDGRSQTGCSRLRNMVSKAPGSAERRQGLEFVNETPGSAVTRMFTFDNTADDGIAVAMSEGVFRFHVDGATVLASTTAFITTRVSSGVNFSPGVMQIAFSTAHGYATGDAVTLTYSVISAGAMISGLSLYTIYYAISVDATHIRLAETRDKAIAGDYLQFLDAGAFIAVHRVYTVGESVGYPTAGSTGYVCQLLSRTTQLPIATAAITCTFATGTNRVTATNHGYSHGSTLTFDDSGGGTFPPGVTAGTVYYALPVNGNEFQISATYGTGPAIVFSSNSTGTLTTQAANAAVWDPVPADGAYEVEHPYAEEDLFDVTYDQSGDIVSLAHEDYPPAELRRISATHWTYTVVEMDPESPAPVVGTLTANFGESMDVQAVTVATPAVLTTISSPGLQINDIVYLTGTVGDIPTNTFYRVRTVVGGGSFDIELSTMDGGQPVGSGNTTISGGKLRYTGATQETVNSYQISAVDTQGVEGEPTAPFAITNNLNVSNSYNILTWYAVAGAERYRIYRQKAGLYGLIGEVDAGTLTFTDENLAPDIGRTPPIRDDSLSGMDYPAAVGHFQQRRVFAGTRLFPQDCWMTQTGTESDNSYHLPLADTDRIRFTVQARQRCSIRHIVPMDQLMLLSNSCEFRVTPVNSDAITPSSVSSRPQSYVGASTVRPVVVDNSLVFIGARGGRVYEFGYQQGAGGFVPGNLSLRADHLFAGLDVQDMAVTKSPEQVVWCVSTNGMLLGLSYVPSEGIGGWHAHETDGAFESVCVVPEDGQDSLYCVVRRTIDGDTVRYVERMRMRVVSDDLEDGFYVDCGLTYSGAAATVISGLDHLEGETVVALADGIVRTGLVVASGQITLPVAASLVHVGLPYRSTLQTLPLVIQADGYGAQRMKGVTNLWLRVYKSARFEAGTEEDLLEPSDEIDAGSLYTGVVRIPTPSSFDEDGQVMVVQDDPTPLTVVALCVQASIGG